MRNFGTIKAYKKKTNNPNWDSPVSSLIRGALEDKYLVPTQRVPSLRPSSFPKCPILDSLKIYRKNTLGYLDEQKSFPSSYFTGVGTVVHEIIQHHIGNTTQIYGNWKCTNLDCKHGRLACTIYDATGKIVKPGKVTREHTTKNKCPGCKRPMHYEELEITFRGITGHVDCVMVLRKGKKKKWWVVDYKTTLKRKVEEGKLPEAQHLYQLQAYCYILKFEYNLPIEGFSLVYLPRDNPFDFYEYRQEFSKEKQYKKALSVIETEQKKWASVEETIDTGDFSHAICNKPCQSKAEYDEKINFYTPCPLLGICFKKKKLSNFIARYKKAHDAKCVPKLMEFSELVEVISNTDLEDLKKKYGNEPDLTEGKRSKKKRRLSVVS